MILKKIIIENFRSHEYLVFEPALIGVTAISGENGAGKSTIVDAFAWSIFGTRPQGLRNKDFIREGVDAKEEKVQVTSFIKVGNTDFKIRRRLTTNEGTCECKVYSFNHELGDWEFETGPAVSHAESFIRNILNTDEKGFLSSVFIQQKQVDQIISAPAKDRGKVIEKLIGVSAITEGAALAKEESRALQKAASIIQPGSLEDEKKKAQEYKALSISARDKLQELESKYENVQKELEVLRLTVNDETLLQNKFDELSSQLSNLKLDSKYNEDNLSNYLEVIKNNSEISVDYQLKEIIEEELNNAEKIERTLLQEINHLKIKVSQYKKLFEKELDYSQLKKDYNKLLEEITEKRDFKKSMEEEFLTLKVKIQSIKKQLDLLKSGVGECPLCGHPITNPEEDIKQHTEEQISNKEKYKELSKKIQEITTEIESLNKTENLLRQDLDIAKQQKDSINDFKEKNNELAQKESQYKANSILVTTNRNKLANINANEKHKNIIENAKEQIKICQNNLNTNKDKVKVIEEQISNLNILPKRTYKELLKNLENKEQKSINLNLEIANAKGELNLILEQARVAVADYRKCKKANEDYKDLHNQLTIMNLTNQSLNKFKELRIKVSIPELTDIASEILSRITDNKFNQLILTDKFNTYVMTSKGTKRPVSLLSGGELSAAAIALRLAIALFLNNGQQHLLILDEVLTAMSSDRSQLILETITSLTNAQVIIIAHNDGINSFADKVVRL